jgi:hypothetical protein
LALFCSLGSEFFQESEVADLQNCVMSCKHIASFVLLLVSFHFLSVTCFWF